MAPRRKQYPNAKERNAASRAKQEAKGLRQVQIWLSAEAIKKLDSIVKEEGARSRGQVIEGMIKKA